MITIEIDGERLREYRERELLTQAQFAERVGVTAETMSKIENGRSVMISTARRICDVTGIQIDDLRKKSDSGESSRASEAS